MKDFKMFILLFIVFVIGLNFQSIKNKTVNNIKHSAHIQYCNDVYSGNGYKINACLEDFN